MITLVVLLVHAWPIRAVARGGATCGIAQFYHDLYEVFSDVGHMTRRIPRKSQRAKPDRYPDALIRSSGTYPQVRPHGPRGAAMRP
ncbi:MULTISPECIES: hypothetical protein [unclassified Streptomyces]|uniref:hypothetical protein n=1 Tax=unclassified Streptomyces TaxID=2593676 RepID=UPI002DD82D5D|nr:hypothetical protein [Streptomyces sp. NBC_01775]WSB75769.1 hypothetical protein OHB04_08170 [Streptomyces sp. NBC_01775]WSS44764.1 hypothetical protein OG220_32395 [Streptomyces sp. NBC_01187]